ncbi:uncharacterized protein LOC129618437 isoform X2 [Condylostylus longicornis]|uniref:uncharacterized protein LOC129618437 isoform X2 n=1 Tax=Condylostylus longicornis TaxID=2530218 RepID=UPI00244E44FC|nr:uncharacterized protein LOC129618437 isoform X2 [Condylostylus longicornis]
MSSEHIINLEKSVQQAGSQLNTVADKLVQVERNLAENSENGELIDDVRVLELLESMAEVKNDYQNLRKDIKEVQQLQKEMTNSIRYQMKTMHQTFVMLKKKIEINKASQN